MKPQNKYFLTFGLLLFLFASTGIAYASSSTFFTQAQKFINQNCNKKLLADHTALLCYLFNKSQEQDTEIAKINQTISPIPSQITSLNQQYQTLSASMSSIPTQINWDIMGTYTVRFYWNNSPLTHTIHITTVDPSTGQFNGTGEWPATTPPTPTIVSGVINGSQFTMQIMWSINGSSREIDIAGSIAPNGTLWGIGTDSNISGISYNMVTLSGAATKKN